jgi:hypothetical protein
MISDLPSARHDHLNGRWADRQPVRLDRPVREATDEVVSQRAVEIGGVLHELPCCVTPERLVVQALLSRPDDPEVLRDAPGRLESR